MLKDKISITALTSISPLGDTMENVWQSYENNEHYFRKQEFQGTPVWIAPLHKNLVAKIEAIKTADSKYKHLDKTVLYALYTSRNAVKMAGWTAEDNFGINIGSSRGATELFEKYHAEYLSKGKTASLSSPTTTLGNISSWVSHDLQTKGPEVSHSITCSTALHSLLNGVAWITSGMAQKFLVGGSEAPLTPFTIAQMQALKIYSKATTKEVSNGKNNLAAEHNPNEVAESGDSEVANRSSGKETEGSTNEVTNRTQNVEAERSGSMVAERSQNLVAERSRSLVAERSRSYPCRALDVEKTHNTMVLGEGAAMACLEKGVSENALAIIEGVGFATEPLQHNVSISTDADCFQRSMKMALGTTPLDEVDIIVMHAPGTIKGDQTEKNAIHKVFGNKTPFLTTNKWKIGHTFGASGMLNIELAVLMLQYQKAIKVPFITYEKEPKTIRKILVNAVGFGGNAVSVLLSKS